MKKYDSVLWVIGLCSFVALFCSGCAWLLGLINISGGILNTLKSLAGIVLTIVACICGWLWLSSTSISHTPKVILQILFVIFAILAVCGYINWL